MSESLLNNNPEKALELREIFFLKIMDKLNITTLIYISGMAVYLSILFYNPKDLIPNVLLTALFLSPFYLFLKALREPDPVHSIRAVILNIIFCFLGTIAIIFFHTRQVYDYIFFSLIFMVILSLSNLYSLNSISSYLTSENNFSQLTFSSECSKDHRGNSGENL